MIHIVISMVTMKEYVIFLQIETTSYPNPPRTRGFLDTQKQLIANNYLVYGQTQTSL